MYNMLWISPYAPYDTVAHAGGKVHNCYVKYLHKSGRYHITLLSICLKEEESSLDLDDYGIANHIFVMDRSRAQRFRRRATSAWSFVNPFDRYAGTCLRYERTHMLKMLRTYQAESPAPDIVMLQWTFSVMFAPVIRKMFPKSKIVAIEEDVTFLGYRRKWEAAEKRYDRWFWKQRYHRLKKLEIDMLQKCDLVVANNTKDAKLLLKNGIDEKQLFIQVPYFKDYSAIRREAANKDILFYGDMSRAENYLSALWFIDHVMPLIDDEKVRFVVVGAHPHKELLQRESERVKVTGYVEDASPYFAHSMCFVAPLLLGAGIKIKVLEALSSGIPVLTNHIGIEGIDAVNGRDYIHCETAEEYAAQIWKILAGVVNTKNIGTNAATFLKENFQIELRLNDLIDKIDSLALSST